MPDRIWSQVDDYLEDHLIGPDPVLDEVLAASDAAGLPPIAVSPLQGRMLHLLARAVGARWALEIGALAGYSTIWVARALQDGGRLVTLESDPRHAAVTSANIEQAGLADRVEVRLGPAARGLSELATVGAQFDFVFIDADKRNTWTYFDAAVGLCRGGALLVVDNLVARGDLVATRDPNAGGMRSFVENVGNDPRVEAVGIQTVGVKGHDGFALALVVGGS
ncbi:MAG: O-methyltransferase [Acidimicrobiales bacterium]